MELKIHNVHGRLLTPLLDEQAAAEVVRSLASSVADLQPGAAGTYLVFSSPDEAAWLFKENYDTVVKQMRHSLGQIEGVFGRTYTLVSGLMEEADANGRRFAAMVVVRES